MSLHIAIVECGRFLANSLSAIAAYCFFEKKPAIDLCWVKDGQLTMF